MKSEDKVFIKLQIRILRLMMAYILSSKELVKTKGLLNIRKFLAILDMSEYKEDFEKYDRLKYIKLGLKARIDNKIEDRDLIHIWIKDQGHKIDTSVLKEARHLDSLNKEEINYIDKFIFSNLRSLHIQRNQLPLIQDLEDFEVGNYEEKDELMNNIMDRIKSMLNYERKIRIQEEYEKEVDFGSSDFEKQIREIIQKSKNEENYLYSGSQWLNEMVGGAFEAGRCYMFLGPPKSFKSGLLLTLALWFRKYNKGLKLADPTKRPCIIYVTQENSVQETIERIYTMETNSEESIKDADEEKVVQTLTQGKYFTMQDSPIGLNIVYKPAGSICTDDLYSIIEDCEDEGNQVICLIHDHVKKIRPRIGFNRSERHQELGSITEDFCTIAKVKNLVFIATAHMNRNALAIVDQMKATGKSGQVAQLKSSDIGESLMMAENCDASIVVKREENTISGQYVLGFKLFMSRVKSTERECFYIPFAKNKKTGNTNTIRLMADYGKDHVVSFEDDTEVLENKGMRRIDENHLTRSFNTSLDNEMNRQLTRPKKLQPTFDDVDLEDDDGKEEILDFTRKKK